MKCVHNLRKLKSFFGGGDHMDYFCNFSPNGANGCVAMFSNESRRVSLFHLC
jgi:hypothetical protein